MQGDHDVQADHELQPPAGASALVLGIGNVLWADEGFGVRAVEAFHDRYALPANATLMDGGTQGLILLPEVTARTHVLVFDAIDFGLAPGTLLAIADVQDRFPPHLTLVGVQPERLMDFGGSLSASVRAQIDPAIEQAFAQLQAWGYAPTVRSAPPAERLNDHALELAQYEAGRPGADAACRVGDARFLNIRHAIESGAGGGAS